MKTDIYYWRKLRAPKELHFGMLLPVVDVFTYKCNNIIECRKKKNSPIGLLCWLATYYSLDIYLSCTIEYATRLSSGTAGIPAAANPFIYAYI